MKEKAIAAFKGLKPNQKGMVVMLGVGVALTVIGLMAYFSSSKKHNEAAPVVKETKGQVVAIESTLLAKNKEMELRKDVEVAKEGQDILKKELEEQKKREAAILAGLTPPPGQQGAPFAEQQGGAQKHSSRMPPTAFPSQQGSGKLPPPPLAPRAMPPQGDGMTAGAMPLPAGMPPQQPVVESEIGGIGIVEYQKKEAKADKEDKKKDEKRGVYLPISYMEATLLSGLDAPTSADAKGNPVPVLIRVKTPAVLPNEVKANLRGCFVVADGKGNLGTERAELVLVSLSCLDRKGHAVIDQSLTGYVVDADGKAGLRGRVVSKMGSIIARSMMAGLFGGFGDAVSTASATTSMSALGSVSQIKPEDIGMAGLGKGLANAFKEVQKFYMELAHQTLPVIEIGAARPLTLVVTKGTTLEIKKLRGGR